jgi:phospholipid transport system substrate-binding protein
MSMHRRSFVATIAFVAVMAAVIAPRAFGQSSGPEAVIKSYQDALLGIMKRAKALGYAGRYKALEPAVRQAYDLAFLARRAAGSHWRTFKPAQRQRYVSAFARLSIATHAGRFTGFGGERFKIEGTQDAGRGYRLVRTRLLRPNGETISINYLMGQRGGAWKIVDVFTKGTVSEVATRRSEFGSVLRDRGVDALIKEIEAKIAAQQSG